MQVIIHRENPSPPPIKLVELRLTPDEAECVRYMADYWLSIQSYGATSAVARELVGHISRANRR